ncbi:MAG: 30S ribosomal protein S30e [Acidobacteriaceae bacterium]|nr:30S ribosomal protein S30e [Acidobacteriaceae bacterium]
MHGSLTRAGKVKKQTPPVAKKERHHRIKTGRAKRRVKYNKRFANVVVTVGKKRQGLNPQKKE